jgi:hypothetical protein
MPYAIHIELQPASACGTITRRRHKLGVVVRRAAVGQAFNNTDPCSWKIRE